MFFSKLFQGPPITPLRPQFIKPWSMWFNLDFYSCILTNLSFKNRTDLTEWYSVRAIILIFNIYAAEKIPWYYAITNVFLSSESQKHPLLFQLWASVTEVQVWGLGSCHQQVQSCFDLTPLIYVPWALEHQTPFVLTLFTHHIAYTMYKPSR